MKAIAAASQKRSLADFQKVISILVWTFFFDDLFLKLEFETKKKILETYKEELIDDPFIRSHLDILYDNLLEQNLSRIIEPFSKVQIDNIAHLIKLPKVCYLH